MIGLTDRQAVVLDFVRSSLATRGIPPTLREIGAHMGIRSTNGVNDHLMALERKGYLTREDNAARGLRLVGQTSGAPGPAPVPVAASDLDRERELERELAVLRARRTIAEVLSPLGVSERRELLSAMLADFGAGAEAAE